LAQGSGGMIALPKCVLPVRDFQGNHRVGSGTLVLSELTDVLVSREKFWILFSLGAWREVGLHEAAGLQLCR
jgi:hypothetical protein